MAATVAFIFLPNHQRSDCRTVRATSFPQGLDFLKTRFVTSRESLRQQTKTFTLRYFQNKVLHCSTVKPLDSVAQGTVQRSPLEAKPRKRESCSGSAGPELERVKKNMAACGRLRVAGNAKTSSTWDHKQGPKKNENSTHQSTPTVYRNLEQRIDNVMILGGVRKQSRNQSRKQGRVTGASVVQEAIVMLTTMKLPALLRNFGRILCFQRDWRGDKKAHG